MVNLGQKLKMPKTCQKSFCKNIGVVVWKKAVRKNIEYSRNETILKIGHLTKAIAHAKGLCKIVSFGQKLKMPKTCE